MKYAEKLRELESELNELRQRLQDTDDVAERRQIIGSVMALTRRQRWYTARHDSVPPTPEWVREDQ
jgi:hypothetical protein